MAKLRLAHIGFVFQTYHLFPTLTAIDNVRLALEVGGERPHRAVAKAKDALAMVGLAHKIEALPLELSSGEQQRVAIARAMVGNAAAILADEPTAALDSENGFHHVVTRRGRRDQGRGVWSSPTMGGRCLLLTVLFASTTVASSARNNASIRPHRRNEGIVRIVTMLRSHWLLAMLGIVGVATVVAGAARSIGAQETTSGKSGDKGAGWQSVAPGVVEPVSGEIKILAAVAGRVGEVSVAVNDNVIAGEPVLRLDEEAARARVATARAQVAMRERVRNDQSAGRGENRRNAEDDVASAEATLGEARAAFDAAALAKRAGNGSDTVRTTARAAWTRAQDNLDRERARLRKLESESGTPLPTQKESELQVARSELRLSVAELEK